MKASIGRRTGGGAQTAIPVAWLAIGFVVLGLVAILAPVAASLVVVVFVALSMVIWGALGVSLAFALRPIPEWRLSAAIFGAIMLLGAVFLAVPTAGAEALTLFLVAAFLAEGVSSVLLGLRLSQASRGWPWMVASGVAALAVGLAVLIDWPGTATWLLGLLLGINFLTTGLALLVLRRAVTSLAKSG